MILTPRSRYWLIRIIQAVFLVELAWLVLINAALRLDLTQDLINRIRPEKFNVSWDSAWTWYPGQVNARGISANGQSRSQQWQFETDSVSGAVALLPLLLKQVRVRHAAVTDIGLRLRPRLRADKDYTALLPYFPDIEGRDFTPAITAPRKKKRPWQIYVREAQVQGDFVYWIYQFSGRASGELAADLDYLTRGGPLSLDVGHLDLVLKTAYVNQTEEIFQHGLFKGSLGFTPFVPHDNKGIGLLNYLLLDVEVDLEANRLAFINLFTLNFNDLKVGGSGRVEGRLNFAEGYVLEGTDLSVDADDLWVRALSHRFAGDGDIQLRLGPETGKLLDLAFAFQDLQVIHSEAPHPLLMGQGLVLKAGGDGRVVPDPDTPNPSRALSLSIGGLTVPDLSRLQRYLPAKWPFRLYGGTGILAGSAELSPRSLAIDLSLDSDEADLGVKQYRFDTDLDAVLKLENPDILAGGSRVGGSYIRLSDARLTKEGGNGLEPWHAALEIRDGQFSLLTQEQKTGDAQVVDLLRLLGQSGARQILANSSGVIGFESSVSSLAWIGVLFGNDAQTGVSGRGAIEGKLYLESGWPQAGTNVEIRSESLAVNVLDYTAAGDGRITLEVQDGGENPDWLLQVSLNEGTLKRLYEAQASIHDVEMELKALVEDMSFGQENRPFTLEFAIPAATVTDMSVFNNLLPPDAPLQIAGGAADLTADIVLQRNDADGWVRLRSNNLEALVDNQSVSGDLEVDVFLTGGVPADMAFDISGSEVRLGQVRVVGAETEFEGEHWSSSVMLRRGETVWTDPPRLEVEAELRMSDSRPFVAMFKNQEGWRPGFLSRMITVEDIAGTANVSMAEDRILIPHAHVTSDNIEVGAKAAITEQNHEGVLFLGYKNLDALIRFSGGKRNLDLIRVRDKFEAYRVEP